MRVTLRMVILKLDIHQVGEVLVSWYRATLNILCTTDYCFTGLNTYIQWLDDRIKRKIGKNVVHCKPRVYGPPRNCSPPGPLPLWMLCSGEATQQPSPLATHDD